MKKKNMVITMILLVLLFSYLLIRPNTVSVANQYIGGKVTGTLNSRHSNDSDAYYVRVTEPGTLTLVLEKEPGLLWGTVVEVLDSIGKTNIRYDKNPEGNQVVYVYIPPSDLTANGNQLDFRITVRAIRGYGTYHLTILKPGQTVTDSLMSDTACFEVQVKPGDTQKDFLLTWDTVMNDLRGISTVQVKILEKATKKPVFNMIGADGQSAAFPSGKIEWPILEPGTYQVIVERKGSTGGSGWTVTRPVGVNPFHNNFVFRSIEQFQTDSFDIQLNGDEKFLWVSADRPAGSTEYIALDVNLKDSRGNVIPIQRLSPSNIVLVPLAGIRAGHYSLRVINYRKPVSYSLGIEKEATFEPVTIVGYRMKQTMIRDQKINYEVTFQNPANQRVDLMFRNNAAFAANVKLGRYGYPEQTVTIPARQEMPYTLTFGEQDIKRFYLLGAEDVGITCDFGYENYDLVTMDCYEEGNGNNVREDAREIGKDMLITGNISSRVDVDFYKLNVPVRSAIGVTLKNIPQGKDYDSVLLNSAGVEVTSSKRMGNSNENLMRLLLEPGDYYLKVFSASGFSSSHYVLKYSLAPYTTGHWYTQKATEIKTNWNVDKLDILYFPETSSKEADKNASSYSLAEHFYKWGCVMTSHATLLTNLGLKTKNKYFDIRTSQTDYLVPDPFVVMMVHNDWPTFTPDNPENPSKYTTDFASEDTPVEFKGSTNIEKEFGYSLVEVDLLSLTLEEKARKLTTALKNHPEGILVRISKTANPTERKQGDHSLVFINSSFSVDELVNTTLAQDKNAQTSTDNIKFYSTLDLEKYFTVCDPYASTVNGENVNFKNSWSYLRYGGLPHLVYLQYYVKK